MKSFTQFQEDSSSDAQSAISGSGGGAGGSSSTRGSGLHIPSGGQKPFKKRPSTGIGAALKDRLLKKRDNNKQDKPKGTGPTPTDGPGQKPDRSANPYRQKAAAKQQRQLPPGREQKALPPGKEKSVVKQRTAAAKQPPQHKQISARPASTAMAGSRQKAIGPAKNNLSRDNQGVQKVNVRVQPQKALPPGEGKPMMSGGARPKIAPRPQKALAPGRG